MTFSAPRNDASQPRESNGVFIVDPNWPSDATKLPFVHATNIRHLKWDPTGFSLLSVEESGKICLWEMGDSVDEWKAVFEHSVKESVILAKWLRQEREVFAISPRADYRDPNLSSI